MSCPIEDYALLGDTESAALVSRHGSIDWLTFPRFDSAACFAALLGDESNGRWKLAPAGGVRRVERRYRPGTLVLETEYTTDEGTVVVVDTMPVRDERLDVVRLVQGRSGRVPMRMELTLRMDYGSIVPWVRHEPGGLSAVAGPDAVALRTPAELVGQNFHTTADFSVAAGDEMPFVLTWYPSCDRMPEPIDPRRSVERTQQWWEEWSAQSSYRGEWAEAVSGSLVVLKALTYAPTGGLVAAATTSLPEELGGNRNWDYRYCWLRDATITLLGLLRSGYTGEARAWRDWLLRAVAGDPADLQIMYGPAGERRLTELELGWLSGYEGSRPVRIGNAASDQFQLDVYGEVMEALYEAHRAGLKEDGDAWSLQQKLMEFLEGHWRDPDDGIWEVRGGRRQFTHSKVMAWLAADRAVRIVEELGRSGPVDRWRRLRSDIHADVLAHGVDERGVFVQEYGGTALDASLLMVPLVGFLPPSDPRVANTVAAIEHELLHDGFVVRYLPSDDLEGLGGAGREGAFLMCTFWLTVNYALLGRSDDARALFERLLALRNDVGLLAEEYDPRLGRMLGNFPQAFSHTALVNTAAVLSGFRLDDFGHRFAP